MYFAMKSFAKVQAYKIVKLPHPGSSTHFGEVYSSVEPYLTIYKYLKCTSL